jgi:hypothetical protein
MQRLKDDRGAMAVTFAMLLLLIFAVGAAAVDVGALWNDRRQLQNGADAAALAVAENCASTGCGNDPNSDADYFAKANRSAGNTVGTVVALSQAQGSVKTKATGTTKHWFAPLLGYNSTDLSAQSTAVWGAKSGGVSSLPLAFSLCEIKKLTTAAGTDFVFNGTTGSYELTAESNVLTTIKLIHPGNGASSDLCSPLPSGAVVPGGFSWIDSNINACTATTSIGQYIGSDPGNPGPSACTLEYLSGLLNKTVLLPVFDEQQGTGNGAKYKIYGYVGFTVKGLWLQSPGGEKKIGDYSGCSNGNGQCVKGVFSFVSDTSGDTSPTAPDLGASTIRLTMGTTTP